MRFIISGKNLNVTDGLRTAIYEKFGKLERYFTPETEIHVTLSVEKNDTNRSYYSYERDNNKSRTNY